MGSEQEIVVHIGSIEGSEVIAEAIHKAIASIVGGIYALGNGNAATPMGALENLSMEVRDGIRSISDSIDHLATATEEGSEAIAESIAFLAHSINGMNQPTERNAIEEESES